MHDTVIIHVPMQRQFVKQTGDQYSIIGEVAHYKIRAVGDVKFDYEQNKMVASGDLKHPFESLPSSHDGMAIKFYSHNVANTPPYIALNASYKFLQGHNVYGGDDIRPLVFEMLATLKAVYPFFYAFLDIENARISRIDCTFSACLNSANLIQPTLKFLSNISNGHRKKDKDRRDFFNTVYWGGKTSNWGICCAYGKHNDLVREVKELQRSAKTGCTQSQAKLEIFNDDLMNFSEKLIRFEARTKKRTLEKLQIPFNLWQFIDYQQQNPNILQKLWKYWFDPVFDAMKGEVMTNVDDSRIEDLCRQKLVTVTKSGKLSYTKANNAINFYKLIKQDGWERVKGRYSNSQFHNLVKGLVNIGIPKAHLQNLRQNMGEEIPLIRLINVDFTKQAPEGYQPVQSSRTEFNQYLNKSKSPDLRLIA